MMFRFTINASNSRGDRLVHQIYAEHPASSIATLAKGLVESDVLVVEEFFTHDDEGTRSLQSRGMKILNWQHVVKVDEYQPRK